MAWKPDQRDWTPEPPAYLDPLWVLRMRARVQRYIQTGKVDWLSQDPKLQPSGRD